jgi:homoserine acetyltransferase
MNTTKLVSAIEMNARFASHVSPQVVMAERGFYDTLLDLAGQEVDFRRLVFAMTEALGKHSGSLSVNVSEHLRAMVGGDFDNVVVREAEDLFERLFERLKDKALEKKK